MAPPSQGHPDHRPEERGAGAVERLAAVRHLGIDRQPERVAGGVVREGEVDRDPRAGDEIEEHLAMLFRQSPYIVVVPA
jgi:hypothetical protein